MSYQSYLYNVDVVTDSGADASCRLHISTLLHHVTSDSFGLKERGKRRKHAKAPQNNGPHQSIPRLKKGQIPSAYVDALVSRQTKTYIEMNQKDSTSTSGHPSI